MAHILPQTYEADIYNCLWDELVLQTNCVEWSFVRELIENFWQKVIRFLCKVEDIEIERPSDKAWFHFRRAHYPDRMEIDVLRLKRGFLSDKELESLRLLGQRYSGIKCANWRRWNPEERHDNAFLSFLQKLSVLRVNDRICCNRYLGKVSNRNYGMCLCCQEAYKVMITPNCKWSGALYPWFEHMSSTNMDKFRTHEYAHWFVHILSGWPDVTD